MRPMGPHCQLKCYGKMPTDYRSRARQPAQNRMRKRASKPSRWPAPEKNITLNETIREPAQKRQHRCRCQNQRSSNRHQEKVLHHVNRERLMIKCGERRRNGSPCYEESTHECGKSPIGDEVWESPSKTKPSVHVDQGCDDQRGRSRDWEGP